MYCNYMVNKVMVIVFYIDLYDYDLYIFLIQLYAFIILLIINQLFNICLLINFFFLQGFRCWPKLCIKVLNKRKKETERKIKNFNLWMNNLLKNINSNFVILIKKKKIKCDFQMPKKRYEFYENTNYMSWSYHAEHQRVSIVFEYYLKANNYQPLPPS